MLSDKIFGLTSIALNPSTYEPNFGDALDERVHPVLFTTRELAVAQLEQFSQDLQDGKWIGCRFISFVGESEYNAAHLTYVADDGTTRRFCVISFSVADSASDIHRSFGMSNDF